MNTKAEKFNEFIKTQLPNIFRVEEIPDSELHAVVFNTAMEVDKQNLPFMLVLDDSIYVMFQVRIAHAVVNDTNKAALLEHINKLNENYKVFKYYLDEQGNIIIESVIPSTDTEFVPELVHAVINVVFTHLQEEYKNIMRVVWTN